MEQKVEWIKNLVVLIPMVVLTAIFFFVYWENPMEPNVLILNIILTSYVFYLVFLYFFLKKDTLKYLRIYMLLLLFFSYVEVMNYVIWSAIFPFNIFIEIGKFMVSTVVYPIYYSYALEATYEHIIQNTILYFIFILFNNKYLRMCQKKPYDIFLVFTLWVTIVNGQIGYRINYFAPMNDWYNHGVVVSVTFFLWLGVIYRQRRKSDMLKILYRICLSIFIVNAVYAVFLEIKMVPGYLKSILKFISDLTIMPFSMRGAINDGWEIFYGIAVVCMAALAVYSKFLLMKNFVEQDT